VNLRLLSIALLVCVLPTVSSGQQPTVTIGDQLAFSTSDQSSDRIMPVSALTELSSSDLTEGCTCGDSACSGHSDFCTRKTLTNGFWGGVPKLAEHGITYRASITQFYQGVASGGNEQRFRYGNKIDQYVTFDTAKLGLWEGGKLIMHGETQLGQNSISDAPALAPVNTVMLFPLPEAVTAITHFQYEQELGQGFTATVGKFNFVLQASIR
jgi:porin